MLCCDRLLYTLTHAYVLHLSLVVVVIVVFAVIFAVNSSIHSFLVVNYAKSDKVAVSVGFYYMSNAAGRLMGTIGSGILYTYVGEYLGPLAGNDAVAGMAACFLAGTICSFVAAVVTQRIDDNAAGLKCGSCLTIVQAAEVDISELPAAAAASADLNDDTDANKKSETQPTEHYTESDSIEEQGDEMWA